MLTLQSSNGNGEHGTEKKPKRMSPRMRLAQRNLPILLARKEQLEKILGIRFDEVRSSEDVGDSIDDASNASTLEMNVHVLSSETRTYLQICKAIDQIREKAYGLCDCGRNIHPARLGLLPWATDCVACARQQESAADESDTSADWHKVYERERATREEPKNQFKTLLVGR